MILHIDKSYLVEPIVNNLFALNFPSKVDINRHQDYENCSRNKVFKNINIHVFLHDDKSCSVESIIIF